MPTLAEFDALRAIAEKGWDATNKGYTFGSSPAQIFLPATGFGYGTVLRDVGKYGYYLSSSVHYLSLPSFAYALYFNTSYTNTAEYARFGGRSVRPFSE